MWITKIVAIVRVFHDISTTSNDKSETTISRVEKKPTVFGKPTVIENCYVLKKIARIKYEDREQCKEKIIDVFTNANILGWKTKSDSPLMETMWQIAALESTCDPTKYNGEGLDRSYGLFQINLHGNLISRLDNQVLQSLGIDKRIKGYGLFDPTINAKIAKAFVWANGFILTKKLWSTLEALGNCKSTSYYQHGPDFSRYVIWVSKKAKDDYLKYPTLLRNEHNCDLRTRQSQTFSEDS
jgi:hypothetical protein